MLTAITGINWGDEGKGRMVDLLSEDYDIVVRYQGGNNAGHTVINHLGKFILNLLPSGILREDVVNVMGNGMVIDLEHLDGEVKRLTDAGVKISPENLKISDRAVICMPYHKMLDCLEEDRLGDAKYGSTRRGIAPVYGDKYMKKDSFVYDVGTGSGILAILSSKLGARKVVAIDLDKVSVSAAKHNVSLNNLSNIEVLEGNLLDKASEKGDLIVANIIAEVIVDLIPDIVKILDREGIFITSGIIESRVDLIKSKLSEYGLDIFDEVNENGWFAFAIKNK